MIYMDKKSRSIIFILVAICFIGISACSTSTPANKRLSATNNGKPKVLATTTIVGDVVRQIGDEHIELTVLLPAGSDPHSFEPTPKDIATVADADAIFLNGAGLEEFMIPLHENIQDGTLVVDLSDGLDLQSAPKEGKENQYDPHVWMDPNNVIKWVGNIETNLSQLDPSHSNDFKTNAGAYRQALTDLDAWVQDKVGQIPESQRKLVSDHYFFGYFASHYGFEVVGASIPSFSTLAEPDAQELADLEDSITKLGVGAIFVGNTVNPTLADRLAEDTGIKVVPIYTGSLSEADGPADTYLDYIRYNINAIVDALK